MQANLLALPLTRWAETSKGLIVAMPHPSRPRKVVAVLQGLEEKAWLRLVGVLLRAVWHRLSL